MRLTSPNKKSSSPSIEDHLDDHHETNQMLSHGLEQHKNNAIPATPRSISMSHHDDQHQPSSLSGFIPSPIRISSSPITFFRKKARNNSETSQNGTSITPSNNSNRPKSPSFFNFDFASRSRKNSDQSTTPLISSKSVPLTKTSLPDSNEHKVMKRLSVGSTGWHSRSDSHDSSPNHKLSTPNSDHEGNSDDDEDDDEDYINNTLTNDYFPENVEGGNLDPSSSTSNLNRRLTREDASSIIGGSRYTTPRKGNMNIPKPAEAPQQDDLTPTFKTFSFSLPFGINSGTADSIFISSLFKIRSGFTNKYQTNKEKELDSQREVIRNKIERQLTISTVEEELYFKDVTKLEDSKFAAIRKALLPSLSQTFNNKPDYLSVYDTLEGDVLIMGGYRGSILRDAKTGRRAWIPVLKAGLNIKKINLLLGPSDEDELNAESTMYADEILSHVGPVDICRKLIRKLDSNPKVSVHNYGYDWRLSPQITSKNLHQKLISINEKNGNKGVLIIAHSMGGILAHSAMLKDPSLVRAIIYVGTPLPCCNMLGPLRFADQILLCKDLLTSEVNFMMRSSFVFVPREIRLFKDKNTGERYDIDFFKAENWVKYNLSPVVSSVRLQQERGESVDPKMVPQQTNFAISFEEAYAYLERTLKRTADFLDSLAYDPSVKIPPLAVVYGNKVPSVKYSMVDGIEDIVNGNYYDFFYGPGDGVTHQNWVFPTILKYPVVGKFSSSLGHVGLLTDLDSVGRALLAVLNEEKKRSVYN